MTHHGSATTTRRRGTDEASSQYPSRSEGSASETTTSPRGAAERHPDQQSMIVLEEVSKTYPRHATPAVAQLDLAVPRGSIVMIVEPSGCGKTTTLKMMTGLHRNLMPTGTS